MLPFRSELRKKTSSELPPNFERISIEFRANTTEVRVTSLRTSCKPLPKYVKFRSNFERTSLLLQANFALTSNELRSNFKRTSNELRELYSSHGNIFSVPTVRTYVHMYICVNVGTHASC